LGNLIDWQLNDQQGSQLIDGTYLYLVTVGDFSDHRTQKFGTALLEQEQVYLEQGNREGLSSAQNSALDANTDTGTLSPIDRIGAAGLNRIAVTTSSTAVAPSSLATRPQQTVTTSGPQTAAGGTNATGAGTQNKIAKWTDKAGALGDSIIFESANGRVGMGTSSPGAKFHVVGTSGALGAGTFQLDSAVLAPNWTGTYPAFEVLNSNLTDNNVSLFQFSDAPSGAAHAGIAAVSTSHANKWGNLFLFTKQSDGYQIRMGVFGVNVGIGTTNPQAKLDVAGGVNVSGDMNVTGNAVVAGNIAAKYQDVAEWVHARKPIAAGTVVVLDTTRNNAVVPSHLTYDTRLAGVVSAQPGVILGEGGAGKVMVATSGRVKVKVDASRDPIRIGDLLVTSTKPGLAMKSRRIRAGRVLFHRPGTIIGKALEPLAGGEGEILVLLGVQ
jgi:hypothetical protein